MLIARALICEPQLLLLADGQVVSAGPAETAISTEHVSAAFSHPIDVQYHDGRWLARAARRSPVA